MPDEAATRAARELVDRAIAAYAAAQDWQPGVVAGWVLLVDTRGVDNDTGYAGSGIATVWSAGIAWSQLLGMTRSASCRAERDYLEAFPSS